MGRGAAVTSDALSLHGKDFRESSCRDVAVGMGQQPILRTTVSTNESLAKILPSTDSGLVNPTKNVWALFL